MLCIILLSKGIDYTDDGDYDEQCATMLHKGLLVYRVMGKYAGP